MPAPSVLAVVRHTLSRAFRETGQALDRLGIRGAQHATTTRTVGDDPYIFDDHLSRHRQQIPLVKHGAPVVDERTVAFLAPCATLAGRVHLGEGSSVWYGAVLRADHAHCGINASPEVVATWRNRDPDERRLRDPDPWESGGGGGIWIGRNTNVQDGCVVTAKEDHTEVGEGVTIGHSAQIHSATVGDYALIGMGSVISPLVTIEAEAFVAAGSVVGRGEAVKAGELWGGNPAKKLRDLTQEERTKLKYQSDEYVKVASGQSGVMELGGNMAKEEALDDLRSKLDSDAEVEPKMSVNDEKVQVKAVAAEKEELAERVKVASPKLVGLKK